MECSGTEQELNSRIYRIGPAWLELRMPVDMPSPENLELFRAEPEACGVSAADEAAEARGTSAADEAVEMRGVSAADAAGYGDRMVYTLLWTDQIMKVREMLRMQKDPAVREVRREDLELFLIKTGECRIIGIRGRELPYAASCQTGERSVCVWFDREIAPMMEYDTVFDAALSLERLMIESGAMILHSAYMCLDGQAVLFSAPSETGKSTQAALWEKYRGTRTVNGDRSLLIREPDGWYAGGWPICGSSEICHNETLPIRAIVMLRQAPENRAYLLPGGQAFRELMAQITSNTWDRAFQTVVADQLERLIGEVPVLRLECDISEQAVACLEAALAQTEPGRTAGDPQCD